MRRVADLVVRWRVLILILALLGMVAAGAIGGGVAERLSNGGFEDPEAESVQAAEVLADQFGVSPPEVVIIATAPGSVDDQEAAATGVALGQALAAEDHVTSVASYWTLGAPPPLRSVDGNRALVFVTLDGDQSQLLDYSATLADKYRGDFQGLGIAVGGEGPLFAEVTETVESDLVTAESIALPITLILLVIVFGSVVSALLPLGVGVFAIVGTFLILDVLARVTEVSIFALNLTTALGLGLAIDYALFVVSRFREELALGNETGEAVRRTVQSAGRTVLFSAGTVMVSLAAMLVFPLAFLRSFGYAGIAVVALAAIGAVVVLPALLAVLGPRVEKLRVRQLRNNTSTGVWHRIAMAVMKRPVPIATIAIGLLVFLGLPFLDARFGQADDRVLPPGSEARVVGDLLRTEFAGFDSSPIDVVALGLTDVAAIDALSAELSTFEGVARVDSQTGTYLAGAQAIPASLANMRFASDGGTYLQVVPAVEPGSAEAEALVEEIRGMDAPVDLALTGPTASLVDSKEAIYSDLPLALAIIGAVTFVVLFLMFGSILVPAKAVILNLLSLSATFGSMVWIFQQGHLADLLGFAPTGQLDLTMPILMFAIAFGLSMDYEVFLLSRIKEEYDHTGDNVGSVAAGLERTGRVVTSAAVLIAVVMIAFATSGVTMMKMFGIGMTLAVLVDAFIVRATLVPAFMRLAGRANWWAPRFLRNIYDRFGFSESGPPPLAPIKEPV
ncbi:MAG: MMPL family transporter [Acidimicrobiia bacterium]